MFGLVVHVVLSFIGFYWVLLGLTGFYLVLPSLEYVSLGFTGATLMRLFFFLFVVRGMYLVLLNWVFKCWFVTFT